MIKLRFKQVKTIGLRSRSEHRNEQDIIISCHEMHKRAATTSNIKNALVESQEIESGQILQSLVSTFYRADLR